MKPEAEKEYIEHRKSTAELDDSMDSFSAILNKHGRGTLYFGTLSDGTVIGSSAARRLPKSSRTASLKKSRLRRDKQ